MATFTFQATLLLLGTVNAFTLQVQPAGTLFSRGSERVTSPACMGAKGFGKPPPAPPPPKKMSEKSVKRSKAADDFDKLKATGAPEYMVFVRTVDSSETASEWMPVGGIAVPRSSAEDMALSMAIFQNEDDLLSGAFKAYPKLKTSKEKFEYGYRLREFPDDPIKIASQEKTKPSTGNPIVDWFNSLDSGLNVGGKLPGQ